MTAKSQPKSKVPHPLVAKPMREAEGPKEPAHFKFFFQSIASHFPALKKTLAQANMNYTPAGYVMTAFVTAFYIAAALLFLTWVMLRTSESVLPVLILLAPVFYLISFLYYMGFPQVKAKARAKKIDQELVFAGRHMLITLKAGVPLYDAMLGITRDYGIVSEEFNKVVEKVTLGVSMGAALHSVAEENPSAQFNRLVLQMANSIASGADIAATLEVALDQISKEQAIELKAYGQKLNPLVMFFMIFGIILPSLGIAFLIILVSFIGAVGLSFTSTALFGMLFAIGLLQFLFLSVMENSRPKFDIV